MTQVYELKYTELKHHLSPKNLQFHTTEELEPLKGEIIGQDRAVKALDFGLEVKAKGYNIYMSGPSGTGKTTYAKASTAKIAAKEPVPYDWCYVYNFTDPRRPLALRFQPGQGKAFRDDMNELVEAFNTEIQKAFSSDDYEKQKSEVVKDNEEKRDALMKELTELAKANGFGVKSTNSGIYFMPIIDGATIDEEQYDALDEKEKEVISANSDIVQEKAAEVMRNIRELEKQAKEKVDDLDYKVCMFAIGHYVNSVQEKYKEYERVIKYVQAVQEDVLDNIDEFLEPECEEEDALGGLLPMLQKKPAEDITSKYKVNLLVDNSETEGAPVVVDFNPTYYNLIGEVEYDSEFGNLTTDFMKIKSGLFHKANGGYLILQAQDILLNMQSWEAVRRVLKTGEITVELLREHMGAVVAPSLKPEPIPVNLKVIMIGSGYYYDLLHEYDEDFQKLFKIRADFDYEMTYSDENVEKLSRFVRSYASEQKLGVFNASAVCGMVEYASRLVERQDKLSTRFNQMTEVLCEASTWAKMDQAPVVDVSHIKKAIQEKESRLRMYEEKLNEMLDERVIMIDTDGEKVGQINGLAVFDMGSYEFGNPSRITATTYMGKSGIVNIEKEAEMSGQTHNKGVQIITGYLGQTYAQDFPLSLSCRICFEQNYSGIDGDSASSTELYCIISSLAELPIRQDLAVTGSINQRGEIQAIGGVTYKVEGFFDLCNRRGLTGTQGVIIPMSNRKDLVLKDEVIEAVKKRNFHIYAISHIDEGIELLMGMTAGKRDKHGKFPAVSVHGKVLKKLREYHKKASGETSIQKR